MEEVIAAIEIFAGITGVLYVILEVFQKNAMWYVGILTGVACAFSFAIQHVWASMGLNIYYVAVSFWGLWQWRRDGASSSSEEGESLHLRHVSGKVLLYSAAGVVLGTAAIWKLLSVTGDPYPLVDGFATVLSAIGTLWLTRSYPGQWWIWVVADLTSTALCLMTGMYSMAGMYLCYTAAAVYGYFHWMKKGQYVDSKENN